jgi:hypothetical protein
MAPNVRATLSTGRHGGTRLGLVGANVRYHLVFSAPVPTVAPTVIHSRRSGIGAATAKGNLQSDLRPQYPPTLVDA